MSRQALEGISYEDLLDMELQFFQQLPYARMGRYLHLLCRADAP
jgi:hypothetical protein